MSPEACGYFSCTSFLKLFFLKIAFYCIFLFHIGIHSLAYINFYRYLLYYSYIIMHQKTTLDCAKY